MSGRAPSGGVDVGVGGGPADRDAQRAVGVDPHRLQHRRRLEALREHALPEWAAMPRPVEAEQHGLGLDAVDAEADEVGEPARSGRRRPRTPSRPATAASTRSVSAAAAGGLVVERRRRSARRRRRRGRRAPGRSPARPGGPAPGRRRRSSGSRRRPAPDEQRAGAGRPAELVAADRQQVGAEAREVDRARGRRPGRRRRGRARRARGTRPRPSATGWMVPTSWLPHWTWTERGVGARPRRAPRRGRPGRGRRRRRG